MKRCPVCHRSYTDQSQNFCLADGAFLSNAGDSAGAPKTGRRSSDVPTEVLPAEEARKFVNEPTLAAPPRPVVPPPYVPPAREPGNRKLLLWVVIIVLLAGGVGVAVILTRSGDGESGTNVRARASEPASVNTDNSPAAVVSTPAPIATATPSATPSPSPTPTPTPASVSARSDAMAVINAWAESLRRQDLGGNLRLYADRLDSYYQLGSVTKEQVRANRQAIFAKYFSSTSVQLDNVSIEVDSSATEALVSYDNAYDWRGGAKYLTGKSRNQMVLSKVGSQWLITSEEHLKTYFENSGN